MVLASLYPPLFRFFLLRSLFPCLRYIRYFRLLMNMMKLCVYALVAVLAVVQMEGEAAPLRDLYNFRDERRDVAYGKNMFNYRHPYDDASSVYSRDDYEPSEFSADEDENELDDMHHPLSATSTADAKIGKKRRQSVAVGKVRQMGRSYLDQRMNEFGSFKRIPSIKFPKSFNRNGLNSEHDEDEEDDDDELEM